MRGCERIPVGLSRRCHKWPFLPSCSPFSLCPKKDTLHRAKSPTVTQLCPGPQSTGCCQVAALPRDPSLKKWALCVASRGQGRFGVRERYLAPPDDHVYLQAAVSFEVSSGKSTVIECPLCPDEENEAQRSLERLQDTGEQDWSQGQLTPRLTQSCAGSSADST